MRGSPWWFRHVVASAWATTLAGMDNDVRHAAPRARFDRQGRRLLVLGIGVLAVLVSATVLALKDLGAVMVHFVAQGTPV